MDLLCQRCGEPYEVFYITDEMTEEERKDFHAGTRCPSCCKKTAADIHLSPRQQEAVEIQSVLRDVLGDDIDGLAAEMEDCGLT